MKKRWLTSFALITILTGLYACGGGSDGSSSTPPPSVDPSTTETPFGVSSMTVAYDRSTTTIDYTYDDNGEVSAVSATVAYDQDEDGRDDNYQTADVTIDPSIVVAEVPELEDMMNDVRSLSTQEVQTRDSGELDFNLSTSFGDLPGAVTHIEARYYSYDGQSLSSGVADDMIMEQNIIATYAYDANGCVTGVDSTNETASALYSHRITFAYNDQQKITSQKRVYQRDQNKDGWVDVQSISEITYTYDASGNKISKTEDYYDESYLRVTTYTYDESGILTGTDYKRIRRGSETVVDHETTAYSHDSAGRLVQKILTQYSIDEDGIETPASINTYGYAYDDEGRLIEKVRESDGDADPLTDNSIYTDTYAYNANGLATYVYICEYASGGGYTYTYDMTYNTQGQLTENRRTYDSDNDDIADGFRVRTYAYDDSDRLVSQSYANYSAADGEPDTVTGKDVYDFSYDEDGRLVGFTYSDYDNGTDIDDQMVAELSYDASGTSASGTLETFSMDETTGILTSDGPAKTISYSFAAEAPTATMAVTVESFPYDDNESPESFEDVSVSIDIPALYGLFYTNQVLFSGPR